MRHSLAALLASSLLLITAAATAQEPAPAAPPAVTEAPAVAASEDEEVTCEREAVTGSRVKKRMVCMTERQRAQERESTSQALGGLRSNQTSNGN